ncbi:hypothetical protein K3G63_02760 [Hymenobacter sp. HSC-4F20]|uniref:hypothetical protein n=1 Tax=Hymenobacter sp. HSC-4F20 TaxID=2864135 RepID=UPI001C72FBEC|nr:hypothetical protein [Hymenobacter sp. HSC-4F20]MBX0289340.1 hypothetical protein [Hymenobacter sp. HSC-4F20]
MPHSWWRFLFISLALAASCQPSTPTEQGTTPPPVPDSMQPAVVLPAPRAPDTVDWMGKGLPEKAATDTTFQIDGKLYRLRLSATADSAHMLRVKVSGRTGEAYAADSSAPEPEVVQGPAGRYLIQLQDAAGRTVLRKEFHKPDFYAVAPPDEVVVSLPAPPQFLGYYPNMGGLAFWQLLGIPDSDVGTYVFYMLDLRGQVRELSFGNQFGEGRADCAPLPAPGGAAFLTCDRLLRVGRPPLPLQKPHADLALARFLSDSTLLTIYQYGEYAVTYDSAGHAESMEWKVPPRMQNQPNAFVLNFEGMKLAQFRYQGFSEGLGYTVPRAYVPTTDTYYLLDEERGLQLIDKKNPTATREVKFRQMSRFRSPRKLSEVRFVLTAGSQYEFYVDKSRPERIRYRRLPLEG